MDADMAGQRPTPPIDIGISGTASGVAASPLLLSHKKPAILIWEANMSTKAEVWQGTLALMVLKTLNAMGPQHGYGIARRIEQVSGDSLTMNQGTIYPALLRLEQRGWIKSEWGISETNRRAKFYSLSRIGRKKIAEETENWERVASTMARFLAPSN